MKCEKCGKEKARYIKGRDICQSCYRAELGEYSFWDYKSGEKKLSKNAMVVCQMIVEQGKSCKEIASLLKLNLQTVQKIKRENLKRVNVNGNEL